MRRSVFNMGKVKKIANQVIIWGILLILAYEIPKLRAVCKAFILFIQKIIPFIKIDTFIKQNSISLERVILVIIALAFVANRIIYVIAKIFTYKTYKAKGKDAFEISLLRYLKDRSLENCYLISGQWGVGKTHKLNEFIKKYYKKSIIPVYRISCIGLNTRENVFNEITKQIEKADNSVVKDAVQILKKIPVIGDFLESILKKSYGYGSAPENSILIVDDFERLCNVSGELNKTISSIGNNISSISASTKDAEIIKAIHHLNDKVAGLETLGKSCMNKIDMDQYVPLVGVLNELVEVYKYKVVIVCNADMLGRRFINDTLKAKLNCIEYRFPDIKDSAKKYAEKIVDSFVITDKNKEKIIKKYVANLDYTSIKNIINTVNLRFIGNIIEALVVTADLFSEEALNNRAFIDSILSSILYVYKRTQNNVLYHVKYDVGVNIGIFDCMNFHNIKNNRWIGYEVAAYWVNNLSTPANVQDVEKDWKDYEYVVLEEDLISGRIVDLKGNYDIIHICYFFEKYASSSTIDTIEVWLKKTLDNYLERQENIDEELVKHVIDVVNIRNIGANAEIRNVVYECLIAKYGKTVEDKAEAYEEYNRYVMDRK